MSLRLFWLAAFVVIYTKGLVRAGVIRTDASYSFEEHKPYEALLAETYPSVTAADNEEESVTLKAIVQEPGGAFSRDEDMSIKIAPASLDPAPGTVEGIDITLETSETKKENDATEKRLEEEEKRLEDEEKQLDEEDEMVELALNRNEDESANPFVNSGYGTGIIVKPEKSAKLLLLSTPRVTKEQEENIEEPGDVDINTEVSTDQTTELGTEMQNGTEMTKTDDKNGNEGSKDTGEENFITRLFGVKDAIFGTKTGASEKTADDETPKEETNKSNKTDGEESKKVTEKQKNNDSPVAPDQATEPQNDNIASAVLIETESDYVLVDTDVEQLGSFTHADSAEHLQPIVQSVEVVPTHFDQPLLVSYVHTW